MCVCVCVCVCVVFKRKLFLHMHHIHLHYACITQFKWYLSWLQYFALLRFPLGFLMYNELHDLTFSCGGDIAGLEGTEAIAVKTGAVPIFIGGPPSNSTKVLHPGHSSRHPPLLKSS